jgi:hypothetical protein
MDVILAVSDVIDDAKARERGPFCTPTCELLVRVQEICWEKRI